MNWQIPSLRSLASVIQFCCEKHVHCVYTQSYNIDSSSLNCVIGTHTEWVVSDHTVFHIPFITCRRKYQMQCSVQPHCWTRGCVWRAPIQQRPRTSYWPCQGEQQGTVKQMRSVQELERCGARGLGLHVAEGTMGMVVSRSQPVFCHHCSRSTREWWRQKPGWLCKDRGMEHPLCHCTYIQMSILQLHWNCVLSI